MKCHKCGKKATKKLPDPYMNEIHPEDPASWVEYWWCDNCYDEQCDEI